MVEGLERRQLEGDVHFVTFSCFRVVIARGKKQRSGRNLGMEDDYCVEKCTHDQQERPVVDPVLGLRRSKSSEQHGEDKCVGVLRLRAIKLRVTR